MGLEYLPTFAPFQLGPFVGKCRPAPSSGWLYFLYV